MSYLYITIPEGWTFKQREINGVNKDVFEQPTGNYIVIQDLVKNCLQHRNKQNKRSQRVNDESTQGHDIEIYYKSPPQIQGLYLKYLPNKNGKEPSSSVATVKGCELKQQSYSSSGYTGTLWFHNQPLSQSKREALEEEYAKKRDNRRHTGESPKAT